MPPPALQPHRTGCTAGSVSRFSRLGFKVQTPAAPLVLPFAKIKGTHFWPIFFSAIRIKMDEQGNFSFLTLFPRQIFSFSLFHPILLERRRRRGAVLYLKKKKEKDFPKSTRFAHICIAQRLHTFFVGIFLAVFSRLFQLGFQLLHHSKFSVFGKWSSPPGVLMPSFHPDEHGGIV